jgi:hypothetical protein
VGTLNDSKLQTPSNGLISAIKNLMRKPCTNYVRQQDYNSTTTTHLDSNKPQLFHSFIANAIGTVLGSKHLRIIQYPHHHHHHHDRPPRPRNPNIQCYQWFWNDCSLESFRAFCNCLSHCNHTTLSKQGDQQCYCYLLCISIAEPKRQMMNKTKNT